MAIAPLVRNSIIDMGGERLRLIRKFDDNQWQLENIYTGRNYEKSLHDLHEGIRTGKIRIILDTEKDEQSTLGKKTKSVSRWDSLSEEHKTIARRRHKYVTAAMKMPRSRKILLPVIRSTSISINDPTPPSFSSLASWLSDYVRSGNDIASLAPCYSKRGRKGFADEEVESVVDNQIEDHYLTRERRPLSEILERVCYLIKRKNDLIPEGEPQLEQPTLRYLRSRLSRHTPYDICCARFGKEYAARKYQTVLGFVATDKPLERVEIDHTIFDLMVIDERTGLPLGRPTFTVALEAHCRCVLGYNLSFEPPSYLAVARCLNHALLPKTYIAERYPEIKGTWDCFGAMETLAVDNGLEFHAHALEDACARFGTTILYCPRAKPWFKGRVERFIGTINRGVAHGIPGTTFSNIFDRADYDPQKTAVVTLDQLNEIIHTWIIDYYHQKVHRSIQKKPATAWSEETENMPIPMPVDLEDFESAFAVPEERTLDKNGIQLFGFTYNGLIVREYLMKYGSKLKVNIRYLPDNIGYIYLEDPETGEVSKLEVSAKFANYATGLSLWQHKVCSRYARKNFQKDDIAALGEAKMRIAELVKTATRSKKLAKASNRFAKAGKKTLLDAKDINLTDSSSSQKPITPKSAPSQPEKILNLEVESTSFEKKKLIVTQSKRGVKKYSSE